MSCPGHKERDICPHRRNDPDGYEFCFYIDDGRERDESPPCGSQAGGLSWVDDPSPLTMAEIERGWKEVQAHLRRMRLEVVR